MTATASETRWAELILRADIETARTDAAIRAVASADVKAWLDSHGAHDVRALAVFRSPDGRYSLHVSELVRSPGRARVDHATDRVVTAPRVIDLGMAPTWPAELDAEVFRPERSTFIFAAENEPEG